MLDVTNASLNMTTHIPVIGDLTLVVDRDRAECLANAPDRKTSIFVRAYDGAQSVYRSADIFELDFESLGMWLQSRGAKNVWAENVVARLLGWNRRFQE